MKFSELYEDYKNPKFADKPGKTKVSLVIGRFQPPHIGHLQLVKEASENGPVVIGLTSGKKTEQAKNPFSFELRKEVLNTILTASKINTVKDILLIQSASIDTLIETLREKGFELETIFCGEDRAKQYEIMANNPKYLSAYNRGDSPIKVEVLHRDPDAEGVEGVSATKVRQALKADDYKAVSKMVPGISQELFNKLKEAYEKVL